ncbi:NAD(P)H-dependent oxidoreductase [Flammeovirgaceae bacterium SG7u.111]|nr:NAD(P)H-dependent oxidoreductase [Flammeovirgaceae bacterium SG7u.132]WPO37695.1 NAD(P)H-dependent oxidoreductase [Flammeovirgaceae bacterium SG7u.111]
MSKKILAFGASNSKESINKQLAAYAANQVEGAEVMLLDLNDFEMPIYGIDKEKALGIPELAQEFKELVKGADGIVISFAEHNGAYTTAFKNIFDWISRLGKDVWEGKPMFLLATSPGARGGKTVLDIAYNRFSFANKNVIETFSLPSFNESFSEEEGIINKDLSDQFEQHLKRFVSAL